MVYFLINFYRPQISFGILQKLCCHQSNQGRDSHLYFGALQHTLFVILLLKSESKHANVHFELIVCCKNYATVLMLQQKK